MNPNLLAALEAPPTDTPIPVTPSAGYGEIVGRNLANVIPRAVSSLGGSLEGILNLGAAPEDRMDIPDMPNWMAPPKLTEAATGGEQLTNVLTGGILPELAALFVPYLGVSKIARGAGLGQIGSAVAGNIAQGAVGGIKYGPQEALEGAALGGGLSTIGAVPGWLRRTALSAPIAATEYALHEDEGQAQAATAAATSLIGGILPSVSRARVPTEAPSGLRLAADQGMPLQPPLELVDQLPSGLRLAEGVAPQTTLQDFIQANAVQDLSPSGLRLAASSPPTPSIPMPIYSAPELIPSGMRLATERPPTSTLQEFILKNAPEEVGPSSMRLETPYGGKRAFRPEDIPIIGGEPPGPLTSLLRAGPLRERAFPEMAWIEAEMPGVVMRQGVPISNVRTTLSNLEPTPLPTQPVENVSEGLIEATKEAGRRGKLRDLPEYKRTEGGVTIPEIVNTLGQVGVGATLGALTDPYLDEALGMDVNAAALGGGLPIARQLSKIMPEAFGINKNFEALFPKYRSLSVDRSGNLKGVMREQGHPELDMPTGSVDARVQGDTLQVLAPRASLTPRQINTFQAFANDHNLDFKTVDRRPGMMGEATQMRKPTDKGKGGFAIPELTGSLGGGIAGGLAGGVITEGDPYGVAAGALLGAGGGAAIGAAFKSPGIRRTVGEVKQELTQAKTTVANIPKTGTTIKDLTNSLNTFTKDLTEGNTYGQGGPFSRLFDFIDKQFRASMAPEVKATITHARGEVARLSERAMAYLKPYLSSGTPQSLVDKANRYLDGISPSITDEVNFIKSNGGIDSIAYDALTPQQRKGYTTWRISEDTPSPKGVGPHQAFKMHVPIADLDKLKDGWNARLTQDFLNSVNSDERPAAEAIVKARGNFNEIQRIFERALPAGSTQQLVTESVGRYVPRLFRAFTDPNFKVSDADVKGYLGEFGLNKRGETLDVAIRSSEAYDPAVFTNLLNKAQKNNPAAVQRLNQFVPYRMDGRDVYVTPSVRDRLEGLKNDVHLENMVRSHLQELGVSEKLQRTGQASGGLDPTLFKRREDLTPGYKKLLGEFTDPVERMSMAFSRTFAPAQAASLMDLAKNLQLPSGLKSAYEPADWAQALQRATTAGDNKLVQELKQMKLIGKSAVFGEYAGNYVNRHLADYFEGGSQLWNQSLGRSIAEFNRLFKTGHVPLNPLSHIRQIMSIPAFLAIGKAAPQDVRAAWNALFAGAKEEGTANALIRDELLSVGAWTSDLIKGELQGNIDTFLSGRYDSTLMKSTKGVVNSILEAYRKPDMLVRAATYLGAKRRAIDSGLSSEEAKNAAIQWMDRYTMNYDNIAPAIRFLRNVPGVSPFISYQSEMVRLVKNMVKDGINGNPERLGTLGLITALPLGAAMVAENTMSPEDKKQWTQTKALMPDYSQGKILIPTGKNPNGSFKYWDISPDIAHSDLIRLVSNVATGNTGAALEQNPFVGTTSSPILQALAKVTTRRDPRTGQELGSGSEAAMNAIGDILPPITPQIGYEWKRLANVEVENLYTGKKESWGDWATRLVTGASGSSVRLSTLQDSLKKEFNRIASNARAEYLRTARLTGENPGLEARKRAAYNEYRQTMADALSEFQQRFQTPQVQQTSASL